MSSSFLLDASDLDALEALLSPSRFDSLPPEGQLQVLVSVAFIHRYDKVHCANTLAQKALVLAHQMHHERGEAYAMMVLSIIGMRLHPTPEGLQLARETVLLAETQDDLFLHAHACFALAGNLFCNSLLREQLQCSQTNLFLYYRANTPDLLAFEHSRMGASYVNLAEFDLATLHFRLAEDQFRAQHDDPGRLTLLYNLTYIYVAQKLWENAHQTSTEALTLLQDLRQQNVKLLYEDIVAYLYIVRADVDINREAYHEAQHYLEDAQALIFNPTAHVYTPRLEVSLWHSWSALAWASDDLDGALHYATQLRTVCHVHQIEEDVDAEIQTWIAKIHAARGEMQQAYECAQSAANLLRHRLHNMNTTTHQQSVLQTAASVLEEKQLLAAQHNQLQNVLTELELAHQQLMENSQRDPLTHLYNRAYLSTHLQTCYTDPAIWTCTTLLLIDVDDFKFINDTFLHEMGDTVLIHIGRILAAEAQVAVRLGGEEFVLVFHNMVLGDVYERADAVRLAIVSHPWTTLHPKLQVTVSVGVAHASNQIAPRDLLQHADAAMYLAKRAGKNQVIVANEMVSLSSK